MNQGNHYKAVRENVGMFDFSDLSKISIYGENANKFLQFLLPGNVNYLELNKIMHTAILDSQGKIVDIIYLYRFSEGFLLVGSPTQKLKTFALFNEYKMENVEIIDETEKYGLVALEGPYSFKIVKRLIGFEILGLRYLRFLETNWRDTPRVICARSGCTGEYGYRILVPKDKLAHLKDEIMKEEPLPVFCNEEVLKTLCQEVRFPYFNVFVKEGDHILEMGLHWFIDFRKEDYLGKSIIDSDKIKLSRRLVGFMCEANGDFTGQDVFFNDLKIGFIKSCAFSFTLNKTIGYALLGQEWTCTGINAYTIDRTIPITTTTTPFFITKSVRTPIE